MYEAHFHNAFRQGIGVFLLGVLLAGASGCSLGPKEPSALELQFDELCDRFESNHDRQLRKEHEFIDDLTTSANGDTVPVYSDIYFEIMNEYESIATRADSLGLTTLATSVANYRDRLAVDIWDYDKLYEKYPYNAPVVQANEAVKSFQFVLRRCDAGLDE